MSNIYAIGIDIGGTKIAGGVVSTEGYLLEKVEVPTASQQQNLTDFLIRTIRQLRALYPAVQSIGIGAAGLVEWPSGLIRWAPNNSYKQLPVRDVVAEATGLPTVVDNDANAAAWAESSVRGDQSHSNMAYLTVGTGVGGGLVLAGELYRGPSGLGAEVGHLVVDPRGAMCGCGNSGCLEAMASGTALERLARKSIIKHPYTQLALLAKKSGGVTGRIVFAAAQSGDSEAQSLFEEIGYWLGIGIATLVNIFELEVVVIGGGVGATGRLLIEPASKSCSLHAFAPRYRPIPPLIQSIHGVDAGIIGAALLSMGEAEVDIGAKK
ncbi:MAG: ROK family protein [Actinomycetota bacterium]|nr:ROK family protein [Actinomycetota bacterium]